MSNGEDSSAEYYEPQLEGINPRYLNRVLCLVVEHGLRELRQRGIRHAMMEVAMVSYLMGMGFDYYTAFEVIEFWERDERFPGDF